jgi:hypothetical protein
MSAYSTIRFSREKAIDYLKSKLDEPHLTNKMLEDLMDVVLDEQLYNCIISDFPDGEDFVD